MKEHDIKRDMEIIDECRRALDQWQYRLIQARERLPRLVEMARLGEYQHKGHED